MRNWISAIFVMLMLTISYSIAFSQVQFTPRIGTGTSDIRATVLRVEKQNFPNVRLTLKIKSSSNPRLLNASGRSLLILARNYLWTKAERVDLSNRRNIGSIAGFYLLQGDEISAKLYTGYVWGSAWYVYDIDRTGFGIPFIGGGISVEEGLQLTLKTDQMSFSTDSPVRMTLSVTNTGNTARVFRFPTGQRYDFIVRRDGKEVWRWSAGRFFTQMLSQLRLSPGKKLEYTEVWRQVNDQRQPVPPGEYEIIGILMTTDPNRPSTGPKTINIRR